MTDRVTGTEINYYFICRRKLWFFCHQVQMEWESEAVEIGKSVHETSYLRKRKEIELEGIKIDWFEKNARLIHEVKKSKKMEESHIWQLKYYLFRLKELGVEVEGRLDYPLLRRTENVTLCEEDEEKLFHLMKEIEAIIAAEKPPEAERKTFCKKCSYFELCFI